MQGFIMCRIQKM